MDSYMDFSRVYDSFMEDVPYKQWAKQCIDILKEKGIYKGDVVDLACGTGSLAVLLSNAGYDVVGIDNSLDMLNVAMQKESNKHILYSCQDMRDFSICGNCKAVISRCDSINYIDNKDDLRKVFVCVYNALEDDGVFIFDINSLYKYENILAQNTIADSTDTASFIWNNFFDIETKINEYDLTLYIKEEDSDLYQRYEELHIQRAYTLEEIRQIATCAGFVDIKVLDADTMKDIVFDTQRYLVTMTKGVV